jgi:diguanylate cyclase (GGDEF)-like protein
MPSALPSATRCWAERVRGWPLFAIPLWLQAFVIAVIAADTGAIAAAATVLTLRAGELEIFAVLLACDLATVELTRRSGEPAGLIQESHAIWELPIALLLPAAYALITPIVRIAVTQWRVRRALLYRRVFTASALGLSYAAASVTFHVFAPPLTNNLAMSARHVPAWVLAVIVCGLLRCVLNKTLVMTAVKGSDPGTSIRAGQLSRESLFHDTVELSAGVVVAYVSATAGPLMALLALPLTAVVQRSQRHEQLVSAARIDGKTNVLNAVTWQREAASQVARARRGHHAAPLAVALMDIDHFKAVNDTYGHLVGDTALAMVAITAKSLLRDSDLIGRFGNGDEFAVLLLDTPGPDAFDVAERLRQAVSEISFLTAEEAFPGSGPQVTVSVGVAPLDAIDGDLDDLVAKADVALYQAKRTGRNRVCLARS